MTLAEIESRLVALESEVFRLKARHVGTGPIHNKDWVEQIRGSFADDPAFLEAMDYGRKWRESQRPKTRRRPKPAKAARR